MRLLKAHELSDALRVWKICFPDDEAAFVRYYFEKRTCADYILGAFDAQGGLVSTVHMLPQTVRFCGQNKRVGFVAGVATLPEARGQGIAARLLSEAFLHMRARGDAATMLKPFTPELERYYTRVGYLPFVYRDEYELASSDLTHFPDEAAHEPGAGELFRLYDSFYARFNGMRVRTEADFTLLKEELFSYDGVLLATKTAYAACYITASGTAQVFELAGETPGPLLKELVRRYGRVEAALPAGGMLKGVEPKRCASFNMLKPLDESAFFEGVPYSLSELIAQRTANYSFESY